jgi:hypothetical protein
MRISAWGKKRQQAAKKITPDSSIPFVDKVSGGVIIALGLFVAATGLHWQKPVTALLTAPK